MNNVEMKFLRGILSSIYKNCDKVILLENKIYDNDDLYDADINSVINILNKIKNKEYVDITFETVKNIYDNLFPKLTNKISDRVLELNINKIVNMKKPENIITNIAINNYFKELNYSMYTIIINIINYKKSNRLTIIPSTIYDKICEYARHNCKNLLLRDLSKIKEINENYYRIKPQTTIENLISTINKISRNKFKLLNVYSISIHGSYAKQKNNEYSDVDLHVVLNNDKYDLDVSAKNIKFFLEKELNLNIDVITTVYGERFHPKYNVFFRKEIQIYK